MGENIPKISERLAAYRKLMNLSQIQMGEKFGINQSHYCKIEAGMKGLSFRNLRTFEENGGDIFFLLTGEHRKKGKLELYLERCDSAYEKEKIFEVLVWAAEAGPECREAERTKLTERTGKCIRLMRNYSEKQTVWQNIRRAEDCSQEKMAKRFDINVKRYRSIEKEESMPDAEILQTLYEKMHYSPLVIMDREMYYMDELNRVWESMPPDYLREAEILVEQAFKVVHISEESGMEQAK